jgi:hypothetical protein
MFIRRNKKNFKEGNIIATRKLEWPEYILSTHTSEEPNLHFFNSSYEWYKQLLFIGDMHCT